MFCYFTTLWISIQKQILREYTMRTWDNIQCVRTFPYNWQDTIHSTYGFSRANYTKLCIVRTDFPVQITRYDTEVLIVPEGSRMKSRMNNTNVRTLNIHTQTVSVYKLYFLLVRNKISLQSVESINRNFFFRPCSFSVVLRSNQWSKGVVSVYQTLLLR